jgi:hypothetical protein
MPAICYWSIPDFFLSLSNFIFSRPISEKSRSGLADGSSGLGPTLDLGDAGRLRKQLALTFTNLSRMDSMFLGDHSPS